MACSQNGLVGLTGDGADCLVLQAWLDRVVAGNGSSIDGSSLLGGHHRLVDGWGHAQQ
jgi:hypothetical protein